MLRRFVFVLGAARVVPECGECHLYSLLRDSESVGRELTNQFYATTRPSGKKCLLVSGRKMHCRSTGNPPLYAKLLDRVLFCAFARPGAFSRPNRAGCLHTPRSLQPKACLGNFRGSSGRWMSATPDSRSRLQWRPVRGRRHPRYPRCTRRCLRVIPGPRRIRLPTCERSAEAEEGTEVRSAIDVDILGHIFEQSITDLGTHTAGPRKWRGLGDESKRRAAEKKRAPLHPCLHHTLLRRANARWCRTSALRNLTPAARGGAVPPLARRSLTENLRSCGAERAATEGSYPFWKDGRMRSRVAHSRSRVR